MKKVLLCGSFDPVTRGHASLIRRAAALFDEVDVVLFENSDKKYLFSAEERLAFLSAVCAGIGPHVQAARSTGTVAGYAVSHNVDCIIKGVRGASDLFYEQDMAALNRLAGAPETLFFPTEPACAHISSSAVREFLKHGLPTDGLLPPEIEDTVHRAYEQKKQ